MNEMERCPGCGLELRKTDGPTHAYIGASPSCWALYNELHAGQYAGFGAMTRIRLIDAYCVQHPGKPERRAIQSVNVHLMALYLQLEQGWDGAQVNLALQSILSASPRFEWLLPPEPNGTLTVADVLNADTPERAAANIEAYARDVWKAWQPHRATALKWAERVMK